MLIYQTCTSQKTDTAEECPDIALSGYSLEFVEKFCNLRDTIGDRRGCSRQCFTKTKE